MYAHCYTLLAVLLLAIGCWPLMLLIFLMLSFAAVHKQATSASWRT